MITAYVKQLVTIPEKVTDTLRNIDFAIWPDDQLAQVGSMSAYDTWITEGEVSLHIDPQPAGYVTLGLILVNDNNSILITPDGYFDLPPGSIYRIDPKKPHGTFADGRQGTFAFLAWDMPVSEELTPSQFAVEALASAVRQFGI